MTVHTKPCVHEELRCKECLRDGSIDYFVRESAKAEGWEILDINEVPESDLNYLSEIFWDWVREQIPDKDINVSYQINIFYQELEDPEEFDDDDFDSVS